MSSKILLFLGIQQDVGFVPRLKTLVGGATVYVLTAPISTITEVVLYCKQRNITGVFTTSHTLLQKLVGTTRKVTLDDWAGSYIEYMDIEFVFIDPLIQLVTVPHADFVTRRYISKLTSPQDWNTVPKFDWCILEPATYNELLQRYSKAFAIAVDIETVRENLAISCIGFTGIFISLDGTTTTHSLVIPMDSTYNLEAARRFCALEVPKILQNGKYDASYLARFNIIMYGYYWDTANLFHSWYSELPKDLAYLGAFFIRKAQYWKDLADTNDMQQYYLYNAKDTWNTALVWIEMMLQMPTYARDNYLMEFPLVYPCHLSEMIGLKRDTEKFAVARAELDTELNRLQCSLDTMLGVTKGTNFNVNSPPQMKALLKILGCADLTSADETNLKKASWRHPLNARILDTIIDIRELRKRKSTYLRTDADITKTSPRGYKEYKGRILYALNPHGTDTGRLASREHHFWCGLQIQNIPRGKEVKQTISADTNFMLMECDLRQAESRDTAYVAGEENLILAVTGTDDFHSVNASKFFGVGYETIFDNKTGKTLNKKLRDLAKRVNHGANYNMGASVMVETMGQEKILEAKKLLNLPVGYAFKDVAEHLLAAFHKTYPRLRSIFYVGVVRDIKLTGVLVGATGWTRRCFSNPDKSKPALNAYIAHVPQSLNAMVLNKAYMNVFYKIALNPEYSNNFRLNAQIHDSILFQIREGHSYIGALVLAEMQIPVTVKGYDGKTRTFTVPADLKAGADGRGSKYWSDTE
jgi:DNA polymerase I-like protein with 3'-5' exonuclease and polymerase domains